MNEIVNNETLVSKIITQVVSNESLYNRIVEQVLVSQTFIDSVANNIVNNETIVNKIVQEIINNQNLFEYVIANTIITRDFTKNFTVSSPAAGGDVVVVWVETTGTITLRPVSGITTYFVVPFMYMGTPVTRTYNAILTAVRNHHGASLTGREMTIQASNTSISVPGAKYVVFVPQLNAQSVTIIGNVVNRGMWFFSNTHVQGNVLNSGTMSGGSLTIGGNVPTGQLTLQGNITNEAPLPRIH
jgi:hypothetical protein